MSSQLIIRLITLAGISYVGYALLIFMFQRQIIYPGRNIQVSGQPPPGIITLPFDTVSGRGEAWFLPPLKRNAGERRPLLIFFHGNGEVIDYLPQQVEGFRELGMGVLLVEYPGFGRSSGYPGETSITETAVAAYDAVLQREEVDPERVVIFGRSLGGGAACSLASRRPSAALILQSTFTSTGSLARRLLVPGFLVRDQFDNGKVVAAYRQPILLFHGSQDTTIPPEHSRELKQKSPNARLIEFPCGHNDFPPDWREFYRNIASFLTDNGVIKKTDAG